MTELRSKLETLLQDTLTDEVLSKLKKQAQELADALVDDLDYRIKSDLAYNLAHWVEDMSDRAITAMLTGDDAEMRKRLSCREGYYNGRDQDHPVIHGRLFETGCIELRKQIVNAHADLLKNQRILDLEDQVKSLVAQVRKLEVDNERLCRERVS